MKILVLKAIYGMLQSALLFYLKLRTDLEGIQFKFNPYDACVANRIVKGTQQTVTFHVDDLKSSHKDSRVNDKFIEWIDDTYGDEEIGKVKATRGKVHDYLGMTLDYSSKGELLVDMTKYVKDMIDYFPKKLGKEDIAITLAGDNLFKKTKDKVLDKQKKEIFHTMVAKGLYLSKRARPDIQPTIAVL